MPVDGEGLTCVSVGQRVEEAWRLWRRAESSGP